MFVSKDLKDLFLLSIVLMPAQIFYVFILTLFDIGGGGHDGPPNRF